MAIPVKIGVVGAGSATFSVGLVKDICLRESLRGSAVTLMDVDRGRVEAMHTFATRYADELGARVTFDATTDRERALREADFVVNTAQVGGHAGVEKLRAWCDARGYYRGFPVANVIQTRFMVSVARDLERLSPDAWLIQASNPLPEGCTAMTRRTGLKVCGLCHGHFGYRDVTSRIGLDPDEVRAEMIGLNHVIYMTRFEHEGRDAYPLLDKWIAERSEEFWRDYRPHFGDNQMSRAAVEQYRLLGLMPIGDTPRAGGWWFHTDLATKKRWYAGGGGFDSEIGWQEYVDGLARAVERIHAAAADASVKLTEEFPPEPTGEQHLPLIDALANDNRVELQVNVPNRGAIEGLPDDVVVEVPATCSRRGIEPLEVRGLPKLVMLNVILPRYLRMERTVSLALEPDMRMLVGMVLDDRRTKSWDQAVAFARELVELPELAELAAEMTGARRPAFHVEGG